MKYLGMIILTWLVVGSISLACTLGLVWLVLIMIKAVFGI